jgi:4-amino-4-deoxy-L-arabinose transferase-like glycosyltransferase
VVFLLGTLLFYLYGIYKMPAWFDEAFTIQQARLPLSIILRDAFSSFDIVHSLYYVISHFLLQIIHDSLITLRLFSLVLTIFTCINLFRVSQKLFKRNIGSLAVGFYLLLPVTFDFATQARSSAVVTFLVSAIINNLTEISKDSPRNSVIKTNLLFLSQITLNVTSVVILPVYLLFIHLRDKELNLREEFRNRFCIPMVVTAPLAFIAKGQVKQIEWIGTDYSSTKQIFTIFLFPFIESENRYRSSWLMLIIILVLCFLVWRLFKSNSNVINFEYVNWLLLLFFLPSVILWVVSLAHPIFLTRYIAYSGLALALVLGILISLESSRSISILLVLGVFCYSILNISHIIDNRDNQYNWELKYAGISSGPKDSTLISSPEWYLPMLNYHSARDIRIDRLSNLETISSSEPSFDCKRLPKMVWLIGISNTIEKIDERRMEKLGYVRYQLAVRAAPGSVLYSLESCKM